MPSVFHRGWEWERETLHLLKAVGTTEQQSPTGKARGGGESSAITFRFWLRAAQEFTPSLFGAWSPRGRSTRRHGHLSPPETLGEGRSTQT